jgi:colicin import membrane protein
MIAIARAEPYQLSAGALALLVHAMFFSLLYFSFSWQMNPPQGMVVDIWDSLPSEFDEQMPAPAQPEQPAQVTPVKVEAAPASPDKADIEQQDRKKKQKEEKQRLEKAAARQLAEKRAEQAERRMEEVERQSQANAQAQHKAQEAAAVAAGKVVDEFIAKIAAKIRRYIVLPPGVSANIRAEFKVTLLPSGEVLNASLGKSSGNDAYDNAVERAILKAQPLPLPPAEKNLFNRFRDLRLKFSPAESGQ